MVTTTQKIDESMLNKINAIKLSGRLASLREQFFQCERHVASERARLAMEGWQETEGEPPQLRQAKKLKKILEGVPVVIHPDELLVGSQTKYFRGGNPQCDYEGTLLEKLMAEAHIFVLRLNAWTKQTKLTH